jgi:hypothetical protein
MGYGLLQSLKNQKIPSNWRHFGIHPNLKIAVLGLAGFN